MRGAQEFHDRYCRVCLLLNTGIYWRVVKERPFNIATNGIYQLMPLVTYYCWYTGYLHNRGIKNVCTVPRLQCQLFDSMKYM